MHLPMAIYTAAVIYAAMLAGKCQLGERPVIALPKVDDWDVVCVDSTLGGENANVKDIGPVQSFVVSGVTMAKQDGVSRRYLADELNGLHLAMEAAATLLGRYRSDEQHHQSMAQHSTDTAGVGFVVEGWWP